MRGVLLSGGGGRGLGTGDESDRGYLCGGGIKFVNMKKVNKNGIKSVVALIFWRKRSILHDKEG